jgi:short-subunit dehydrogenase
MRIKDSVVVITGASSGIGRAAALRFARSGAVVVLAARRVDALQEVAQECEAMGTRALVVPADLSRMEDASRIARRTVERFGRIDAWVNNAAVSVFGSFEEVPLEDFRRVIDVNLMGYVHGARAVLPYLREQGTGVLVNVSSVVGVVPQPYTHAYTMTKAAIISLSGSLRQELRLDKAFGVKVATVLPASIDTPIFDNAANYTGRKVVAMPPVYTAERVARAIVNQVRLPRRQVVVGPMGRNLLLQAKLTPGTVERMMAVQVDRSHLSRTRPAPASSGNLHQPIDDRATVAGGWHGARRTAVRRVASAGVLVGAAVGVRRLRS